MIISPNSGIDLHTGAFLFSLGLVLLLVAFLIENRITMACFLMGMMTTFWGVLILFICLVMKFFG